MKPHKHAEVIKAWADGEIIQHYHMGRKEWVDCDPQWAVDAQYRVKPAEPEREYPETKLTQDKILSHWYSGSNVMGHEEETKAMYRVANAALRHACDTGQIVTREEFDRAVGDRKARDLEVALAIRKAIQDRVFMTPMYINNQKLSISFQDFNVFDIIKDIKS